MEPAPQQLASAALLAATGDGSADIVARGSFDYRGRRYLMVVLLVAMGVWFAYDGFKGWPAENAKIQSLSAELDKANHAGLKEKVRELDANPLAHKPPHSSKDLFFQKMLAVVLPALAGFTLIWALYNSRGEYRLSGKKLSVPGHPNVLLDSIVTVDKQNWERKGIALIEYRTTGSETDAFVLDDFIYEREGTDKIYDIVEDYVSKGLGGGAG